jgi:CubicO group peptidase (beta-lactamase class C family)
MTRRRFTHLGLAWPGIPRVRQRKFGVHASGCQEAWNTLKRGHQTERSAGAYRWLVALFLILTPAGVFAQANGTLPATGRPVPELAAVESALRQFMAENQVQAGTLALAHRGRIVFARGFGWADQWKTKPIAPDTRLRIASISKVLTAAAAKKLIRDGKLTLETRVYEFLGHNPVQLPDADPRLAQITVNHLLRHEGGWDRKAAFDPLFADNRIKRTLGLSRPPQFPEIFQFMLTQPLQFDPGSRSEYSNFGYDVLGLVIAKASGTTLERYIADHIFKPAGVTTLAPARENLQPGEGWYDDPDAMKINMGSRLASGGWIASAPDLCRILRVWWINGEPRTEGRRQTWYFMGSLPGTTALAEQRRGGVDVAVLLNKRSKDFDRFNQELRRRLNEAIDKVENWAEAESNGTGR